MYEDSYQVLGQDYLEHYGVKGMRWGKHVKKKKDDSRVDIRDVVPFSDPKTGVLGNIRIGNSMGGSQYANVVYLDKDGQFIKMGDFTDRNIPQDAKKESVQKLHTMEVAKKKFDDKFKKTVGRVGKTKMSSLNSMKVTTGKDKLNNVLSKLKKKLTRKTKIKTPYEIIH